MHVILIKQSTETKNELVDSAHSMTFVCLCNSVLCVSPTCLSRASYAQCLPCWAMRLATAFMKLAIFAMATLCSTNSNQGSNESSQSIWYHTLFGGKIIKTQKFTRYSAATALQVHKNRYTLYFIFSDCKRNILGCKNEIFNSKLYFLTPTFFTGHLKQF